MLSTIPVAKSESDWSMTIFGAVQSSAPLRNALIRVSDIDESYQFTALALSKEIDYRTKNLDFEVEGQLVKYTKGQHHLEFVARLDCCRLGLMRPVHLPRVAQESKHCHRPAGSLRRLS